MRGLALTTDDLVRRSVIMALMCQGRLDFESIELAHLIRMGDYFASELEALAPLEASGLVEREPGAIARDAARWALRSQDRDGARPSPSDRARPRTVFAAHLTDAARLGRRSPSAGFCIAAGVGPACEDVVKMAIRGIRDAHGFHRGAEAERGGRRHQNPLEERLIRASSHARRVSGSRFCMKAASSSVQSAAVSTRSASGNTWRSSIRMWSRCAAM